MANRIRIAQNKVLHGSLNPAYHVFLARIFRKTLEPARAQFLDAADRARRSRLYPEL